MKLFIKNMVSERCKTAVKVELRRMGLHFIMVDLGEVEVMENLSEEQREDLKTGLQKEGLELMDDIIDISILASNFVSHLQRF